MLRISSAQMASMEADFRQRRRARLLSAVRLEYTQLALDQSDQQLRQTIALAISDGKALDITADVDVLECVAFSLLAAKQAGNGELIAAISRTLNKKEWSAGKRLRFVRANLLTSK